ncbi:MAG: hypothetical protein R2713_10505 [Ilumatobacteraceae bacterium]
MLAPVDPATMSADVRRRADGTSPSPTRTASGLERCRSAEEALAWCENDAERVEAHPRRSVHRRHFRWAAPRRAGHGAFAGARRRHPDLRSGRRRCLAHAETKYMVGHGPDHDLFRAAIELEQHRPFVTDSAEASL